MEKLRSLAISMGREGNCISQFIRVLLLETIIIIRVIIIIVIIIIIFLFWNPMVGRIWQFSGPDLACEPPVNDHCFRLFVRCWIKKRCLNETQDWVPLHKMYSGTVERPTVHISRGLIQTSSFESYQYLYYKFLFIVLAAVFRWKIKTLFII